MTFFRTILFIMFIIADPLSQNVSGTGTFLYYPCFVSSVLMYLLVLFCISSSISTIPWWQNQSSVYSQCRSGRHFPRRLSDLAKMRILRVICLCVTSPIHKLHWFWFFWAGLGLKQISHPDVEVFQKAQLPKMWMGFLTFKCWLKIVWSEIVKGCQIRLGTSGYHSNGAVARKATGWCFFDVSFWCTTVIIEIC